MSLAKPVLFAALGAAGLGASGLGQQSGPAQSGGAKPAVATAKTVQIEVTECTDNPPVLPRAAAPVAAQVARPGQGQGGFGGAAWAAGGGASVYGVAGFGEDPRVIALARKLADADDDARDKHRGELKQLLVKSFDDRLKTQEKHLAEMEKQLRRLKETIGKRKEAKTEIIADRMATLEKEVKGLGW